MRVAEALVARRYAVEGGLVLGLRDTVCPWNTGHWRLETGGDGASCTQTSDPAELVLGPAELASALLGGERLARLARAGRVEECRPSAGAQADRLFHSDPLPWCPFVF